MQATQRKQPFWISSTVSSSRQILVYPPPSSVILASLSLSWLSLAMALTCCPGGGGVHVHVERVGDFLLCYTSFVSTDTLYNMWLTLCMEILDQRKRRTSRTTAFYMEKWAICYLSIFSHTFTHLLVVSYCAQADRVSLWVGFSISLRPSSTEEEHSDTRQGAQHLLWHGPIPWKQIQACFPTKWCSCTQDAPM